MAARVYIKPENLWEFFQDNAKELMDKAAVIAENETAGYEICATKEYQYSGCIVVYKGDDEVERTFVSGEAYAKSKMTDYLLKYIYPVEEDSIDKKADGKQANNKTEKSSSVSRDSEIFAAAVAFFKVLFQTESLASIVKALGKGGIDDCVDSLCYYLSEQYGVSIYYPTEMKYDDGTVVVVDYPYDANAFTSEEEEPAKDK